MSRWVCCNACFHGPGPDRRLAVTTCGHVVCSVCYQKGQQRDCLICKAKCEVNALSDKSSADVKALFSDINSVVTKHFTEICKVLQFQARHQRRLMAYYQQRIEKLEEARVQRKLETQQMSKKLAEQSAYIIKLEKALQQQSAKLASASQTGQSSHNPCASKSVLQIPYSSAMPLSRHASVTSLAESMEVDGRSLFKKPECGSVPRLSLLSPPQDGRMGAVPQRPAAGQNASINHSARSAAVSRWQELQMTPDLSYGRPPSSFRYASLSSLVTPSRGAPRPAP